METYTKPIRVLMVVGNLRTSNGVTSFAMNYYKNLAHSQVKMDFFVLENLESPYNQVVLSNGGKIIEMPSIKDPTQCKEKLDKLFVENQYDIIHVNTLIKAYPVMCAAKRHGVPVCILHSHNAKLGETRKKELRNKILLPLLLSKTTNYAACSNLAGKAMFKNRPFYVIPNVVDTKINKFNAEKRSQVREAMMVADCFVVATVGRTALQKNPFFAIDVFAEVFKKVPNAMYWWIGSGPLDKEVSEYIIKKGLTEHVKLLGSRTDVNDLYQAVDCFLLPSLFEGLPLTAVEAQAFGLPCVISETVTNELVYTDLVQFISLDATCKEWAEVICEQKERHINREEYNKALERSTYSSTLSGKRLTKYYRELLKMKK